MTKISTTYNRVYNDMFEQYAEVNETVTPRQIANCKLHAAEAQYLESPSDENHIEWIEAQVELNKRQIESLEETLATILLKRNMLN